MQANGSPPDTPKFNGRLYAELHLHLGGAILPRILFVHLQRKGDPLLELFGDYDTFEAFFRKPRKDLARYLEMHKLVERIQRPGTLKDFVLKLVRGAYLFEELAYVELRHCPWFRTDERKSELERLTQMEEIVQTVHEAAESSPYPIILRQILCMHSMLPESTNRAIVELAARSAGASAGGAVVAVDLAGPDTAYRDRLTEFASGFEYARSKGLKTTGHLYETVHDCHPELLPYLDRIGHGIQIALLEPKLLKEVAKRGQCLEVCPTSYLKTGTLQRYDQLKPVFDRCADAGVDIALCTDNAGLHMTRLPAEFENLLIHEVIDFPMMLRCQDAAFRHAFAWPFGKLPREMMAQGRAGVPGATNGDGN